MSAPLDTFDLVVKLFCAVVLPLIVILNVRQRENPSTPFAAYLWTEERLLTILGLLFLGVLAAFSMLDLATHFGFASSALSQAMLPVLGVPMAAMALAVLVLGMRAVLKFMRARA